MEEGESARKKRKHLQTPGELKTLILNTKVPLVLTGVLSWDLLNWSLEEWIKRLGNEQLELRIGEKQCTKEPQWEHKCGLVTLPLKEVLDQTKHQSAGTWMYFDYKHIKQHFKNKPELLESMSWADFGFPDKNGEDSTIWIGTAGAYTPCHMDSYGCNIVGQVYGRKLWVLFPPDRTSVLKPTRVPYEESSVYSNIHFSCGLNIPDGVGAAHVVELGPGDVLVVPRQWWHYVENLSTAISVNMWIPLESDHQSRLQEALVRFFVASTLKTLSIEGETHLLNPNEMDLLAEPVDLRQISWCVEQAPVPAQAQPGQGVVLAAVGGCVSSVLSLSADQLRRRMLDKCGCARNSAEGAQPLRTQLCPEHIINAFCHPDVIARVAQILVSMHES